MIFIAGLRGRIYVGNNSYVDVDEIGGEMMELCSMSMTQCNAVAWVLIHLVIQCWGGGFILMEQMFQ